MSKYDGLHDYLLVTDEDEFECTFRDLEESFDFKLPNSARLYKAWWANQSGGGHTQSDAWQNAGWKTVGVDLEAETVRFVRMPSQNDAVDAADHAGGRVASGLTIAQAKAGLAVYFDVPEDRIEITIKG